MIWSRKKEGSRCLFFWRTKIKRTLKSLPAVGKKNIPVFLRSDIIFLPEGSDKVRTAGKAALVGNLLYAH